jgi:hypothetical protein
MELKFWLGELASFVIHAVGGIAILLLVVGFLGR